MAHFTVSRHLTNENYKGFAVLLNQEKWVRLVFLWLDVYNNYYVKYQQLFCDIKKMIFRLACFSASIAHLGNGIELLINAKNRFILPFKTSRLVFQWGLKSR